jgi:hypothetical protein
MNGWYQLPGHWVTEGLCTQIDPDMWFPEKSQRRPLAVAICRGCPVQVECLTWALENDEHYGIWGGTTHLERRRLGYGKYDPTTLPVIPLAPTNEDWHGQPWGAKKHRREKTEICRDCRDAYNSYHRDRQQARKGETA